MREHYEQCFVWLVLVLCCPVSWMYVYMYDVGYEQLVSEWVIVRVDMRWNLYMR